MKKVGRTALISFAGLILALVLLEIALRVIGYIHYQQSIADKLSGNEDYVILTIGDSFTIGVGAPPQYDYPTQLELKFKDKGYNAKVLNRGIGGQNTSQALAELEEQLEMARPDVTVLMIGGANLWNHWGFQNAPARNFLYRIRVFKLGVLLWKKLFSDQDGGHENILEKEKYEALRQAYKNSKDNPQKEANAIFEMGMFFLQEKKIDQAITWFEKGTSKYPSFAVNYAGLGTAYVMRDDYENANRYLTKGERLDPVMPQIYLAHYYLCLNSQNYIGALYNLQKGIARCRDVATFYRLIGFLGSRMPEKQAEIRAFVEKYPPRPGPNGMKEIFDLAEYEAERSRITHQDRKYNDRQIINWIEEDLDKIIKLCKEYDSKVVMMGYPINTEEQIYGLNELIRKVAEKNDVHFLNHAPVFDQLKNKKTFFAFGGQDEHPNQAGYGLMAEVIMDFIIKESLLPRAED